MAQQSLGGLNRGKDLMALVREGLVFMDTIRQPRVACRRVPGYSTGHWQEGLSTAFDIGFTFNWVDSGLDDPIKCKANVK